MDDAKEAIKDAIKIISVYILFLIALVLICSCNVTKKTAAESELTQTSQHYYAENVRWSDSLLWHIVTVDSTYERKVGHIVLYDTSREKDGKSPIAAEIDYTNERWSETRQEDEAEHHTGMESIVESADNDSIAERTKSSSECKTKDSWNWRLYALIGISIICLVMFAYAKINIIPTIRKWLL